MPDITHSTGLFLLLAMAVAAVITVLVILVLFKLWNLPPLRSESNHALQMDDAPTRHIRVGRPRPRTMNEIVDSVSWPWHGTPRVPQPPAPPSTAIVGEGRGHVLDLGD